MRTNLPSLHHSSRLLFPLVFLVTFVTSLVALPDDPHRKTQHFRIVAEDFLRAPLAANAASFENLTGIDLDSKGILYVSDPKNMRSLKFAPDGTFLAEIPWEKGLPEANGKSLFVTSTSPSGLLYAMEPVMSKRMRAYDDRGLLEKQSNYEQKEYSIWGYTFVDDHWIAASITEISVFPQRQLKTRHAVALINLDDWWRTTVREADRRDGGDFSDDFTNIVANSRGEFYFGLVSQKEYVVYEFNKKGEPLRTIKRQVAPVAMKGMRREEFLKSLPGRQLIEAKLRLNPKTASDTKPYFHLIDWLSLDSHDNVWVFTSEGLNDNSLSVDLYDPAGNFKKTFVLENEELGSQRIAHLLVRDGYLYSIVGEQGEKNEHIYRYALPDEIWR